MVGEITDYFRRLEFQMRWTPHTHSIYAVKKSTSVVKSSSDVHCDRDGQQRVLSLVSETVEGRLVERHENDKRFISENGTDENAEDFVPKKDFFQMKAIHVGLCLMGV